MLLVKLSFTVLTHWTVNSQNTLLALSSAFLGFHAHLTVLSVCWDFCSSTHQIVRAKLYPTTKLYKNKMMLCAVRITFDNMFDLIGFLNVVKWAYLQMRQINTLLKHDAVITGKELWPMQTWACNPKQNPTNVNWLTDLLRTYLLTFTISQWSLSHPGQHFIS